MSTIFISDLHLKAESPEINQIFLNFLQQQVPKAEALYILGDFFEYWLGDDYVTDFNQTIIDALRTITQLGIPVYFMHGNRDFFVDKDFMKMTGCQLLPDPTVINLYGTPALLTHGDLLCTLDVSYQRLRKLLRHPWFKAIFFRLSLKVRIGLANFLRNKSKSKAKSYDIETIKIKFDTVFSSMTEMMQKHQTSLIIYGHTHRPSIRLFNLGDKPARCFVLSDWHHSGNALICEPNGEMRLIYF